MSAGLLRPPEEGLEVVRPNTDSGLEVYQLAPTGPDAYGPAPTYYDYTSPKESSAVMGGAGMAPAKRPWWKRPLVLGLIGAGLVAIIVAVVVGVVVGTKNKDTKYASSASSNTSGADAATNTTAQLPFSQDTALAAVGSGRLFYQAQTGDLMMRQIGTNNDTVLPLQVPAKNGTSLAAVQWANATEMRLYYLSSDNYIQEYGWSEGSGWSAGTIAQQAFSARSESKLAALRFPDTNELRLYYQLPNNLTIQELSYNLNLTSGAEWNLLPNGASMPAALAGSGIGAGYLGSGSGLRVWFQGADHGVHEWCWGLTLSAEPMNYWQECTETAKSLKVQPKGQTAIAGVTWDEDNTPEIKILYQLQDGTLVDATWQSNKNWVEVPFPTANAGNFAKNGNIAVMVTNGGGDGAVGSAFYMTDEGVREMTWQTPGGAWNENDQGVLIMTQP